MNVPGNASTAIEVLESSIFRGPNRFARFPVIYIRLRINNLTARKLLQAGPEFQQGLLRCTQQIPDTKYIDWGSIIREQQKDCGLTFAAIAARLSLALQTTTHIGPDYVNSGRHADGDSYQVIYACTDGSIGRAAGTLALQLLNQLLVSGQYPLDWQQQLEAFINRVRQQSLDANALQIIESARTQGIPWLRLHPACRTVQLGYGRYQQRLDHTITGRTSALNARLCMDKTITTDLLHKIGLPVPRQGVTTHIEHAGQLAEKIGYPVVVKPRAAGMGQGVTVGVKDAAQLDAAFSRARKFGEGIIIEQYIPGDDHRLLVVDGKFVAAARRCPASISGDGKNTITQLVMNTNQRQQRRNGYGKHLVPLMLDNDTLNCLEQQGYNADSVPTAGKVIKLRYAANMSTGGTSIDVTRRIHPDNQRLSEYAARAIGINTAGVDFISTDISRSYQSIGGAICEVNRSPGLRPHWLAEGGPDKEVSDYILESLFPNGSPARIPIVAITGSRETDSPAYLLNHFLQLAGLRPGVATRDGIFIGGAQTSTDNATTARGSLSILSDPCTEAAVLSCDPEALFYKGIYYDHCEVCALIGDALVGSETPSNSDMPETALSMLADCTTGLVVVDADTPACLKVTQQNPDRRYCLVSTLADSEEISRHIDKNQPAMVLSKDKQQLILYDQGDVIFEINTQDIPLLHDNARPALIRALLHAAAMAYGLGLDVKEALPAVSKGVETQPLHIQLFSTPSGRALLAAAHHEETVNKLPLLVHQLSAGGKTVLLGAPKSGNQTQALVRLATRLPLKTAVITGEAALISNTHPNMEFIEDHGQALRQALEAQQREDLLLVIVDNTPRWRKLLRAHNLPLVNLSRAAILQ